MIHHDEWAQALIEAIGIGEVDPGTSAERFALPCPDRAELITQAGFGIQRWTVDRRPLAHLDPAALGVAYAPVLVLLRRGPHEITAYLEPGARQWGRYAVSSAPSILDPEFRALPPRGLTQVLALGPVLHRFWLGGRVHCVAARCGTRWVVDRARERSSVGRTRRDS